MYETVVCPKHQVWKLVHLSRKDPLQDVSELVDMLPNTVTVRASSIGKDAQIFIKLPNSIAEVELTPDKCILINDLGETKVVSYEFAMCTYVNTQEDMIWAEVEREFTILEEIAQRCPCPYCNAMELKPIDKTDLKGHYNLLKCKSCKHIVTQLECRNIEERVNKEIARRSRELNQKDERMISKEMNNNG